MWQSSQQRALAHTILFFLLSAQAVSANADSPGWPRDVRHEAKRSPNEEMLVKRGLEAHERIVQHNQIPMGMRKMSSDPDEMFFLDYWQFDGEHAEHSNTFVKNSSRVALDAPLLPHYCPNPKMDWTFGLFPRALHTKRDFQCPAGFSNCASIGRQYSCCATGNTCVAVPDNGLGDVGCCASGTNCGDSIGSCDASRGYKSCPGSSNGGCCMPGFDCLGVGCISVSTSTTTRTLSASNVPPSSSQPATTSATTTAAVVVPPVRPTESSSSPTTTAPPPSDSASAIDPAITTTGTQTLALCPTNFYFCSAYFRPGCCRVGRDCALTNCPAAPASSTLVSNGVTILVPVGQSTGGDTVRTATLTTGTGAAPTFGAGGNCPDAWQSCAQSAGGGCCPGGYACGAQCTRATGTGTDVVGKVAPSMGGMRFAGEVGWVAVVMGVVSGAAMVLL